MEVRLPLGNDSFPRIRESGNYYIDKTGFISKLLKTGFMVTLITRRGAYLVVESRCWRPGAGKRIYEKDYGVQPVPSGAVRYALGEDNAIRQIGKAHQEGIRFDLVLLDWKMPGMNGIQTARKIRTMLPEHIPILLLTAYEWDEIEEEAVVAGIDGFLANRFS